MLLTVVRPYPETESGQAGGQGRNAERKALQRGISPRFVVGREQGQVKSHEQIVVLHIEHPVRSVQIGRNEIDLHTAALGVDEAQLLETAGDDIIFIVHQVVGDLSRVLRRSGTGKFGNQILVGSVVAGRDHYERLYVTALRVGVLKFLEGVDEHVDALVAIFITPADADEDSVLGHFLAGHRRGDLYQSGTGRAALFVIFLIRRRSEAVLEAVRGHYVHLALKELLALLRGDFTDGCEYVRVLRRFLLKGVAGDHVELAGLLVSVVEIHRIVQRQVVAGDAASHNSGVGREHGRDRKLLVLEVKQSGSGLPLVELCHNLVGGTQVEVPETLNDLTGGVAEQEVFLVVPVSGDGIDLETLPVL